MMILSFRSTAWSRCSHYVEFRSYSTAPFPGKLRIPSYQPIVSVGKSSVYPLGASSSNSPPLLRDFELLINEGESWAVIGASGAGKDALLQSLLGHTRIQPPPPFPGGLFPFLSLRDPPADPFTSVSLVSFSHRPKFSTGFYDYSARYGAVRDQDKLTLRQTLFPELQAQVRKAEFNLDVDNLPADEDQIRLLEYLIDRLDLTRLLDLPLIALSNGQTRKARIVKALIGGLNVTPELVILDEGLTGLDASTRTSILELLREVHENRSPRLILGSRLQDGVPDWISHIAFVESVRPGDPWTVQTGTRTDMLKVVEKYLPSASSSFSMSKPLERKDGAVLVDLKNVQVSYHGRDVLKSTNWTIRAGERWHLQGTNGSGKTTLLSMLTGDHPQSYTQKEPSSLILFGRPRNKWATVQLRKEIGIAGMDILNAWPRGRNMSVWDVIGTGFDGGFVPLGSKKVGAGLDKTEEDQRVNRVWEVLKDWWRHSRQQGEVDQFSQKRFAGLPVGEQSVVLLLRAIVGQPKLILLDEAWSGMDGSTVSAVHEYLRFDALNDEQACVVVTHWEDEVPWNTVSGVKKYILREGNGVEVDV